MNKNFILILILFLIIEEANLYGKEYKYEAAGMRDPFAPFLPQSSLTKKTTPQEFKKLNVSGIIWGSNKPLAIINDKLYGIDDTVLGAKVIEIDKKGVLLNYKGEIYLLKPK